MEVDKFTRDGVHFHRLQRRSCTLPKQRQHQVSQLAIRTTSTIYTTLSFRFVHVWSRELDASEYINHKFPMEEERL